MSLLVYSKKKIETADDVSGKVVCAELNKVGLHPVGEQQVSANTFGCKRD